MTPGAPTKIPIERLANMGLEGNRFAYLPARFPELKDLGYALVLSG
jgi:hypothetical protein